MPTPAYMSIEGSKQGSITKGAFTAASVGNSYVEGHEDEVLVQAFDHIITIPRDRQSGQPTGQRVHEPLTITKVFDKSSPLIYNALISGERLTQCKLKWYRTSVSGTQEHYFTIDLEDAIIVGVKACMPNCQDPRQSHFTHLEDVSFAYRKIAWTHEAAGTQGMDDWRALADNLLATQKTVDNTRNQILYEVTKQWDEDSRAGLLREEYGDRGLRLRRKSAGRWLGI